MVSKQGASFYQTSERGPFGDALEEMDDSIGKLIAYLDQAGIRDNTVIVFSSDNGYDYSYSECKVLNDIPSELVFLSNFLIL